MSKPEAEPKTWGAPGYTPGEPVFIPRPSSNGVPLSEGAEDDGVLLSVVLDAESQKSMLVVLDAKDMKEEARAEMDTHFPFGFHGVWVQ
jgi:torulene dioxygenase